MSENGAKDTETSEDCQAPPYIGGKVNQKDRIGLYKNILEAFEHSKLSILPDFPLDFRFIESDEGVRYPIEIDQRKVCHHVSESYVIDAIVRYAHIEMAPMDTKMSHTNAGDCYRLIRSMCKPFDPDQIYPVCQLSTDDYCWHRLPYDLEDGPTPTFDEMFGRMDAGESVMAWIGSLLIADADKQQYLWIYGDGQNGKSALARWLRTILGPAYRSEQVPDHTTRRFWTAGILGKRLVCFSDCGEPRFTSTGFFKGLTGGDAQRIEKKGKEPFDAELDCKFLFLSNKSPLIEGGKSDLRRALYVEMSEFKGRLMSQEGYGSSLGGEGPQMLFKCVEAYNRLCPGHGAVPLSAISLEKIEVLAEESQDKYHVLLANNQITVLTTAQVEGYEKLNDVPFMHPVQLQRVFIDAKISDVMKQRDFILWLERKYGVKRKRVRFGGGLEWRYIGLKMELPSQC